MGYAFLPFSGLLGNMVWGTIDIEMRNKICADCKKKVKNIFTLSPFVNEGIQQIVLEFLVLAINITPNVSALRQTNLCVFP